MNTIYDCVESFLPLLDTEYVIKLGRKGTTVTIDLQFKKEHCFHLMGLQHLKDRPNLKKNRQKIFDEILSRKIKKENIESSVFYSQISRRIHLLPSLESILDSNKTVFKYNKKNNQFSMIDADYLLKNQLANDIVFIFLSNSQDNTSYCKSFFPMDKMDYTRNQASWTLLYKEKIQKSTGEKTVLYER